MDRVKHLIKHLEAVHHSMRTLGGDPCDLIDEKDFSGIPTSEGKACRIAARAQYLLDALACEVKPSPNCCDEAAQVYCDAFDACPA